MGKCRSLGSSGAPGGKHPAPTVYHPPDATTQTQQHPKTDRSSTFASGESIQVLEAVSGKPSASNSTNPQTTMMPKSASIQRAHPIRITEGKPAMEIHQGHRREQRFVIKRGGRRRLEHTCLFRRRIHLAERKDFTIHSSIKSTQLSRFQRRRSSNSSP